MWVQLLPHAMARLGSTFSRRIATVVNVSHVCHVPSTLLRTLYEGTHFNSQSITMRGRLVPYFTQEETEAQRLEPFAESHTAIKVAQLRFTLRSFRPK
jgi:hypothetical protein